MVGNGDLSLDPVIQIIIYAKRRGFVCEKILFRLYNLGHLI